MSLAHSVCLESPKADYGARAVEESLEYVELRYKTGSAPDLGIRKKKNNRARGGRGSFLRTAFSCRSVIQFSAMPPDVRRVADVSDLPK